MSQISLALEAADCRLLARELQGRPEERVLLQLASAFDELADLKNGVEDERSYCSHRAAQEVSAAVAARHPKARLAHLTMAQRYEGRSHAIGSHRPTA